MSVILTVRCTSSDIASAKRLYLRRNQIVGVRWPQTSNSRGHPTLPATCQLVFFREIKGVVCNSSSYEDLNNLTTGELTWFGTHYCRKHSANPAVSAKVMHFLFLEFCATILSFQQKQEVMVDKLASSRRLQLQDKVYVVESHVTTKA